MFCYNCLEKLRFLRDCLIASRLRYDYPMKSLYLIYKIGSRWPFLLCFFYIFRLLGKIVHAIFGPTTENVIISHLHIKTKHIPWPRQFWHINLNGYYDKIQFSRRKINVFIAKSSICISHLKSFFFFRFCFVWSEVLNTYKDEHSHWPPEQTKDYLFLLNI